MASRNKFIWGDLLAGLLLPLGLLVLWQVISCAGWVNASILPSPVKVLKVIEGSVADGFLLKNLLISFNRVIRGFLFGSGIGFVMGTWMGLSKTAEKTLGPFFHAVRNVPLVGWVPLFIIWFGFGEFSQVVFISVGAFYPVVLNTLQGIRGVRREYIELGRVFGFSRLKVFTKIILPAAVPSVFTGVRLSLSTSWMLVVAAELFGVSTGGVGNMMMDAREFFKMDIVIMGILTIGAVGFIMNQLLAAIEGHFLSWKRRAA